MNEENRLAAMQLFEKKSELFTVFDAFDKKVEEAFGEVQVRV